MPPEATVIEPIFQAPSDRLAVRNCVVLFRVNMQEK